jgi:hypothetical protein
MAISYDIALLDNDIDFRGGDMYIVESDTQHVIDTINAFPGWWKENPSDGVGLMSYMKSSASMQALNRSIRVQLNSDGYTINAPVITLDSAGNLFIDPNAVKI